MTPELEAAVKMQIVYVPDPGSCARCQFYEEIENPNLDRSWISVCNIAPALGPLYVSEFGRCSKIKLKVGK